jgi:sirohydrochlorin cobaltochelatase
MSIIPEDDTWNNLEARLRFFLPEIYQVSDDNVQSVSMGSAALKFGHDGKVAWNEMWGSFCDLAMAGGPPHRGTLLEPEADPQTHSQNTTYDEVVSEICRGITLVTGLYAQPTARSGWVRMYCTSAAMASWLVRAIVMENVSAHSEGLVLNLPAAYGYRVEKEIKNVITAVAKTCHYWLDHTSFSQQQNIASLLRRMERRSPLLQPPVFDQNASYDLQLLVNKTAEAIHRSTNLRLSNHSYKGWLGLECSGVPAAIWMMRALVMSNVLSRREGTVVFVPVNSRSDPEGERLVQIVVETHRIAIEQNILVRA